MKRGFIYVERKRERVRGRVREKEREYERENVLLPNCDCC